MAPTTRTQAVPIAPPTSILKESIDKTLPPEIWLFIFEFLDMNTRLTAGLVCWALRRVLVTNRSLWKNLSFHYNIDQHEYTCPSINEDEKTTIELSKCEKKLSVFKMYSEDALESISITYGNLYNHAAVRHFHSLYLFAQDNYSHLKEVTIHSSLNIMQTPHSVYLFLEKYSNQLIKLDMHNVSSSFSLARVLEKFPQLETLLLTFGTDNNFFQHRSATMDDETIVKHPLKSLTIERLTVNIHEQFLLENLEFLSLRKESICFMDYLHYSRLPISTASNIAMLPRLRVLELIGGSFIFKRNRDYIIDMPALEKLVLQFFSTENSRYLLSMNLRFENLKSISIMNSQFLCMTNILQMDLPCFEELEIGNIDIPSKYCQWTFHNWKKLFLALGADWPEIKYIKLRQILNISDACIRLLGLVDKLQTLEMHGANKGINVSCDTLVSLVENKIRRGNPRLKKLAINCSKYIQEAMDPISLEYLEKNVPSFSISEAAPKSYSR